MEKGTHTAYLLLGGNLGDRTALLGAARALIERRAGAIRRRSATFETAAWGLEAQPAFLNEALAVATTCTPEELLHTVLRIETELGRERRERYGPRLIDIDILFYEDVVIDRPRLRIPHPHIQNRRFALACMNDIAPGLRHPVLGQTIAELLASCTDALPVNNFREP